MEFWVSGWRKTLWHNKLSMPCLSARNRQTDRRSF